MFLCLTESWLKVPTYHGTRKIPCISKLWPWSESLYKVVIKIPKSDYNVIILFPKLQHCCICNATVLRTLVIEFWNQMFQWFKGKRLLKSQLVKFVNSVLLLSMNFRPLLEKEAIAWKNSIPVDLGKKSCYYWI